MKEKPNKGFLKELAKSPQKPLEDKKLTYSKAITKPADVQSYAFISRSRALRSVKPDKTTNIVNEQKNALLTHKGKK